MNTDIAPTPCVKEIHSACTITHAARKKMCVKERSFYGISLAIDGRIVYLHNGKRYVSDENHIVILPKGQSYEWECVRSGSFTLVNFLLDEDIPLDSFRLVEVTRTDKFLALHKKITDARSSRRGSRNARVLSAFYEMVAFLMDEAEKNTVPPVLKRALLFIEENLASDTLSNTQLAEMLGISEVYLRKLFAAYIATSPKRYIQKLRIGRAQDMLIGSRASVSEIAEKCGYSSEGMFCRAFKAKNGVTPTEYRRESKITAL